jgi:hypothetical protein
VTAGLLWTELLPGGEEGYFQRQIDALVREIMAHGMQQFPSEMLPHGLKEIEVAAVPSQWGDSGDGSNPLDVAPAAPEVTVESMKHLQVPMENGEEDEEVEKPADQTQTDAAQAQAVELHKLQEQFQQQSPGGAPLAHKSSQRVTLKWKVQATGVFSKAKLSVSSSFEELLSVVKKKCKASESAEVAIAFVDEDGDETSLDDDDTWEEAVGIALLNSKKVLMVTVAVSTGSSIVRKKSNFRKSSVQPPMTMAGFLSKKSRGAMQHRWQKRYFAVAGHYLKYARDEDGIGSEAALKGTIDLNALQACGVDVSRLTLTFADSALELQAASAAEAHKWAMVLAHFVEAGEKESSNGQAVRRLQLMEHYAPRKGTLVFDSRARLSADQTVRALDEGDQVQAEKADEDHIVISYRTIDEKVSELQVQHVFSIYTVYWY